MTYEYYPTTDPHLRAQAEKALQGHLIDTKGYSAEDIQRLVYELQVHQIELELQNEALQQTQHEYEILYKTYVDLYDSAPVGYFTIDENSLILEANQTGARLLGLEKEKLVGQKLTEFVKPQQQDDFHLFYRVVLNSVNTDEVQQTDLQMLKEDGASFYASLEGQRVPHDEAGESRFSNGQQGRRCKLVISDITGRKQMEMELQTLYKQARQDADTRALLLAELDHRTRNNMSVILGLLQLERVRTGIDSNAAFQSWIDNMMSKIESIAAVYGLLSIREWHFVSLYNLVDQVAGTTIKVLPHDCTVRLVVTPVRAKISISDANNLALLINELTANAVQHAFKGRQDGCITVTFTEADAETIIEFRDDGPGFPPDVLTLERTGSGWDLIRNLIGSTLAGSIALHNDGGAVVTMRLPVAAEQAQK